MADLSLEQGLGVLQGRTRWVGILIAAYIVAAIGVVLTQLAELGGTIDLDTPDPGSSAAALLLMAAGLAALALTGIFIASIVLVCMWIYRAHANVAAAGVGPLDITPGWAVGWFFIPFANLFKPFQAMRELWSASHGVFDRYNPESPALLKWWWGFWIVSNVIANIGARAMFSGEPGAMETNLFDVIGGLLSIPAAWLLWQIVSRINTAQRTTLVAASTFA